MLPVVVLVGLDPVQADACRSVLSERARIVAVLRAEEAVTLVSLHRPKLVVMRTDLALHERKIISDLVSKLGGRMASVGEKASPASVEHLIEGFAAVTFTPENTEQRVESGTRRRVRPGEYHFETPRTPFVSSKAKR